MYYPGLFRIEKKDYENIDLYFGRSDFDTVEDIIKHLEGYKLSFKCSKDTIKTFLNKYPSSTAKIIAMMKKFTALTVGKSITDGNIKLTIS